MKKKLLLAVAVLPVLLSSCQSETPIQNNVSVVAESVINAHITVLYVLRDFMSDQYNVNYTPLYAEVFMNKDVKIPMTSVKFVTNRPSDNAALIYFTDLSWAITTNNYNDIVSQMASK